MSIVDDIFRAYFPQQHQAADYASLFQTMFGGTPSDTVNITPRMTAPPMDNPSQLAGMPPQTVATALGSSLPPPSPGAWQPPANIQPMGADNPALASRAGTYGGPAPPLMQGPQAAQLKSLFSGVSAATGMPLLSALTQQQVGAKAPIEVGKDSRLVIPDGQGGFKQVLGAAPPELTPEQKQNQTQGDYNTLDKGSDEINAALGQSPWQKQLGAFNAEQRKPQAAAEVAAAEAKARLPFETQLAADRAKAAQDAANAGVTGANGQAIGITGVPKIDATTPGYTSATIKGTGMTQAAIDLKALDHITGGTEPPQGRTGMAGIQNAAISNRMAEMDPAGNLAKNKTQLRSFSQSLAQQQKYLDSTQRALTTANDTLDALQEWMQKNNVNPNQFPDFNTFSNFLKAKGVDPGVAGGYNAQLATLRAEYSQVLAKGGVRSVETDREAAKLIPAGLAPSQLAQVAERIKVDGMNVTRDAQNQVSKVTGQIDKIRDGNASASYEPPPTGAAGSNAKIDDLLKKYGPK